MVSTAGGAAWGAAGKSAGALGRASFATLVSSSSEVNVGSGLSGRVGTGATCEAGAERSGSAVVVAEAAGCTFSCVPSEMKAGSGLLSVAGITGGAGGGLNATGVKGTTGSTGAAGSGTTTGAAAETTGAVSVARTAAGPSEGKRTPQYPGCWCVNSTST